MKIWYYNPHAAGANNGTSPANAWTGLAGVLALLMCGCSAPKPHAGTVQPVPTELMPTVESSVQHQSNSYGIQTDGGTLVIFTGGPNKGQQVFIASKPTYVPLHTGVSNKPVTVQGSNDLSNWTDLYKTNSNDFLFPFRTNYMFYRTKV